MAVMDVTAITKSPLRQLTRGIRKMDVGDLFPPETVFLWILESVCVKSGLLLIVQYVVLKVAIVLVRVTAPW